MTDNVQNSPRSLNLDVYHQEPGPEQADSPRESTVSGSSKAESNVTSHRSMIPPQGYGPIQGQVLVDPATGQHYIVPPQPAYYPPMQPMYYPPPQPAPMYYPYQQMPHQPHAYPQPMMIPPYGTSPMMVQRPPALHGSRNTMQTEDSFDIPPPPSPSLSFRSTPPQPKVYASPPPSTVSTSATSIYREKVQQQKSLQNEQPDDPESGFRRNSLRGSFEYNNAAAATQGQAERKETHDWRKTTPIGPTTMGKQERTPLYGGPPPWWQYQDVPNSNVTQSDVESRQRVSPSLRHHHASSSDVEGVRRPGALPSGDPPLTPTMQHRGSTTPTAKAVRMDIGLKSPAKVEEPVVRRPSTTARSVRMEINLDSVPTPPARAPRASATAFTVNFDSPDVDLSLQDAARKSAQAKRIMSRRSVQPTATPPSRKTEVVQEQHPPVPTAPASKKYLLQKLLSGATDDQGNHEDVSTEFVDDTGSDFYKRDADAVSNADTSKRQSTLPIPQMQQKIVEHSDDDSVTDDSDDEDDSQRTRVVAPPTIPQEPVPKPPQKSNFLEELAKLKSMAGLPKTAPQTRASPSTRPTACLSGSRGTASTSIAATSSTRPSRLSSAVPTRSVVSTQRDTSTARSRQSYAGTTLGSMANTSSTNAHNSSRFSHIRTTSRPGGWRCQSESRADGGRSSMRSTAPTTPTSQKRPPFRTGMAPQPRFSLGSTQQQRDNEMNAWLRRKDYNPMRAAAEAKKQKDTKNREEQFQSNRSMSFNVGPEKLPAQHSKATPFALPTRRRSQESLAEDAATQASQRVIAAYSRGVVEDISRLSQQSARSKAGEKTSGLSRAVDVLSQKCKKSIELIRSQNKGCLSVSVEDLLSAAADEPRQNESLDEQLDRLSDAFDAVQRYLEQYSLDGRDSPLPEPQDARSPSDDDETY